MATESREEILSEFQVCVIARSFFKRFRFSLEMYRSRKSRRMHLHSRSARMESTGFYLLFVTSVREISN